MINDGNQIVLNTIIELSKLLKPADDENFVNKVQIAAMEMKAEASK